MNNIELDDLLNKAGNALNNILYTLDKSIHSKIKDTDIDRFMHELSSYLDKSDAIYKLSKLPKDAKLELNDIEEKAIECYYNKQRYYIPKDLVDFSEDNDFYHLQLQDDGKYHFVSKN